MNRNLLFFGLCIPIRFLLGYLLTKYDLLKYGVLIMGLGFWYIYIYDLRKTGPEVNGNKIWWNHLRPVHGSLYLLAFILTFTDINKSKNAIWMDTVIGLIATLNHKFMVQI